jgi:hypothetical protein
MPTVTLFANPNLSGKSTNWLHWPDPYKPSSTWRYRWIKRETLKSFGFDNVTSSFRLANATETRMTVVLFDEDVVLPGGGWPPEPTTYSLPHLEGPFRAFGAKTSRDVPNLGDFNDKTSSMLMIRHTPPEFLPVSLADQARVDATAMVEEALSDVEEASLRGELGFSWEMWPSFDAANKFLRITIPLTIDVPNWPSDYKASITYYILLFIDGSGRLRGFVKWCGVWVEGGTWHNSVKWRLKGKAVNAMSTIDAELNSMLNELDFHEWTDYYYMPGTALIPPADYAGDTRTDVTIVLVR